MGSVQSKIKEGYKLHLSPVFQSDVNNGVKADHQNQNQTHLLQHEECYEQHTEITQEGESSLQHNPSTKKLQVKLSKILSNSTVYPYSTVGLIKSNIDGQEVYGTGTIIGKKYVLTCAHNCYSIKNKKATETLLFYPGYTAQGNGPCYKPKVVHFPHSFQNSLEDDSGIEMTIANDYAVLELDTEDNLEAAYGSLGIDFTEDFSDLEKEIIGFSKRHHRHINLHCYKGEGHLDSGIIKYNMPASYGMSGAPIIEEREDQFYIIGLHVYCLEVGRSKQRGGLKMGRRIFDSMEKWILEEQEIVDLREKHLEKEGLKYISKHNWKRLARLTLIKCGLNAGASKYLRKGNWNHLTHLDLGGNSLGKEGIQQFSLGDFRHLKSLSLWGNGICKGGAYYLTLARLDSLQNLNLYHNQLGKDGLENLSKGKWIHLATLHLGNNSITLEAASFLINDCWTRLQSVNLWGNNLEGEQSLIKSHLKANYKNFKTLIT